MTQEQLTQSILDAAQQPADSLLEQRNALQLLDNEHLISINTIYPPAQCILEVNQVGLFEKGNLHAIKAKQKSGKTTATSIMIAAALGADNFSVKQTHLINDERIFQPRMLFIDTEQNPNDTQLQYRRVLDMANLPPQDIHNRLRYYNFRTIDRKESFQNIRLLVQSFQPDALFIDGIVDLLGDFNDITSSQNLIQDLMTLAAEHNCAIICILHTNKDQEDHNMRGHLGTMLAQKASVVLECTHQQNIFTVACSDSRHQPIPSWTFMYNIEGQLIDADHELKKILDEKKQIAADKRQAKTEATQQERINETLSFIRNEGTFVTRAALVNHLRSKFSLGESSVNAFIKSAKDQGLIAERDKLITIKPHDLPDSQSRNVQD